MRDLGFTILLCAMLIGTTVYAEDLFGDAESEFGLSDDDGLTDNSSQKQNGNISGKVLSSFLSSKIPAASAKNIENAEKVFCYTVEYAPAGYTGYMIDDMAVKGSCGELSTEGTTLVRDVLLGNNSAFSSNSESCNIVPKILLRYINGLDTTDVLISAPCHSLTFFHGREITTVNATPGKDIIEQIINAYSSLEEKFLSPALLGQMVANGKAVTQDQQEIARKVTAAEPVKKWGNKSDDKNGTKAQTNTAPAKKGWNKLK
jgi:hypothetical protein